ncbi:hypothetical protein [Microbacterium candidum]|uniref:Primosomal protein n=1 Tax=Microbacterium candidum TaxID=3041922 RepID=A0ABT7N2N8_9MICO|nr:hypothetical protein [Microbacterium sp. ASV49]MDL9980925.1 hypothetical protein [Microbacterium sp. ASV49]
MAAILIDEDPALAHEHALAASRRAGRVAVVRETVAITAYAVEDYALALRELRTYRRISGKDDQIALIVDSERGMGRPDRAIEEGRSVDRSTLPAAVRVDLAIALSGARLDLGETERALIELDIPELDPDRAFEWSPALFSARAAVLDELGRTEEAAEWQRRAVIAAEALDAASGFEEGADEVVYVEELEEDDDVDDAFLGEDDEDEFTDSLADADPDVDDADGADTDEADDAAEDAGADETADESDGDADAETFDAHDADDESENPQAADAEAEREADVD